MHMTLAEVSGVNKNQSRFLRRAREAMRLALGYPARIGTHVSLFAIPIESIIDRTAALDANVRFYRSSIGRYSYIGRGSCVESAEIGSFCSIAGNVQIGGASHPLDHPSTSPVFCKGGNILGANFAQTEFETRTKTVIEDDVWVGYGAIIKAGVTIHTGAVIGMGSVLTKEVGPYEIWAGNPARLIRNRFDEATIHRLLNSRWWEWDDETLLASSNFFEKTIIGSGSLA